MNFTYDPYEFSVKGNMFMDDESKYEYKISGWYYLNTFTKNIFLVTHLIYTFCMSTLRSTTKFFSLYTNWTIDSKLSSSFKEKKLKKILIDTDHERLIGKMTSSENTQLFEQLTLD